MTPSHSYWYDLTTQSVSRDDARPSESCIGPFSTAQEAEESPAVLIEHARAWLESDESAPFRELAAELDDGTDRV